MIPDLALAAALMLPGDHDGGHASRGETNRVEAAASIVPARWRAFARCVENRESHGNPRAVNGSGHAGLYQFSVAWRRGLPYFVARGLKAHGATAAYARAVRLRLPDRIEMWPARYQRIGFAQVIAEGGVAAALRHWSLSGSACNSLAVAA